MASAEIVTIRGNHVEGMVASAVIVLLIAVDAPAVTPVDVEKFPRTIIPTPKIIPISTSISTNWYKSLNSILNISDA